MSKNKIYIGTSGWHYSHWKGAFYPDDLSSGDYLSFYQERFTTVEINNTFYKMPEKKTLLEWKDTVKKDFIFSVKASRFITHMKKLKDPEEPVSNFFSKVSVFKDNLGPILFQLPPKWKINTERLKNFLESLPDDYRYVFEFRDSSWFDKEIYRLLNHYRAAFCIYDLNQDLSPKEITSDFIYIRLHGPDGAYKGQYSTQTLSGWAGAFAAWKNKVETIYCYFDNDQAGYAAQDALRLKKMVKD
jgi:uncharacterized protein YecE (DUF72 family)